MPARLYSIVSSVIPFTVEFESVLYILMVKNGSRL